MKRLILAAVTALGAGMAAAEEITVFAASSLKTALDQIAAIWTEDTGVSVILAYDGSAKLAQQILLGAPADLFISASPDWADAAEPALVPGSRRDLLGNDLVLIGAGAKGEAVIAPGMDLAALLGDGRLAIGQTDSVPAGQYGRQALEALGLWPQVQDRLAEVDSARAVLDLVVRGEAPLGVVFGSDLVAARLAGLNISLIGRFPAASHAPIVYPAALVVGARPKAKDLADYLGGPEARAVFEDQGFTVIQP